MFPVSLSKVAPMRVDLTEPLDKCVSLDDIRNTRGDIKQIRWLLKGNLETCYKLFREAVEKGDAILQIQLSQARWGILWGKDTDKDFSSLRIEDLENFRYYPHGYMVFFNSTYDEAFNLERDRDKAEVRGKETFQLAHQNGYLPATLELFATKWKNHMSSYGFAVQLRPYVGQGDKHLDYHFGDALKNGCAHSSKPYYEGLYWIQQSRGISLESVDELVKKKLSDMQPANKESYFFHYDESKIVKLANEYKISGVVTGSFVRTSNMQEEDIKEDEDSIEGFHISTFSLYEGGKKMGEISVRIDTFEIRETVVSEKIQPVIKFIEDVMKRSGSASSAHSWLSVMGSKYM